MFRVLELQRPCDVAHTLGSASRHQTVRVDQVRVSNHSLELLQGAEQEQANESITRRRSERTTRSALAVPSAASSPDKMPRRSRDRRGGLAEEACEGLQDFTLKRGKGVVLHAPAGFAEEDAMLRALQASLDEPNLVDEVSEPRSSETVVYDGYSTNPTECIGAGPQSLMDVLQRLEQVQKRAQPCNFDAMVDPESDSPDQASLHWYNSCRHNTLEEARAMLDQERDHLPTIVATLQSYVVTKDEDVKIMHSGAVISNIESQDDELTFSTLSGELAGHLLEDSEAAGNFYIALPPYSAASERFSRPKREKIRRWCDLERGEQVEGRWEGTWYQAQVVHREPDFVRLHYVGYDDSEDESIPKHGDAWRRRIRSPAPALHLYGLRRVQMRDTLPSDNSGNGIRIELHHKFKDYGFVDDKRMVLECIFQARNRTLTDEDIVGSLARPEHRRPLEWRALASLQGANHVQPPPPPSQQQQILSGLSSDIEAIQGPPGTGKSSLICSYLSEYWDYRAARTYCLVTCVQNKAVWAIGDKLAELEEMAASSHVLFPFFIVAGARNRESQLQLREKGAPPTSLAHTAWGHALRDKTVVTSYAAAKACSRLMRFFSRHAAIVAKKRQARFMAEASRQLQTVEHMGLFGQDQKGWRQEAVMARWLKLFRLKFLRQQSCIVAWTALTDSILHHNAATNMVTLMEMRARVWLSTVDSTHKIFTKRNLEAVIVDEAGERVRYPLAVYPFQAFRIVRSNLLNMDSCFWWITCRCDAGMENAEADS